MLELELLALKTAVQRTLAHLNIVCVSSEESEHDPDASSLPATAKTNDTRRDRTRPITRWNRRQLTQEVAAVSERRRHLETQLHRDLKTQATHGQEQEEQREHRRNRRRSACQTAILELQQQRAQILRQMEQETKVDAADRGEREEETQSHGHTTNESNWNQVPFPTTTRPLEVQSRSELQYSIGGVVTLEPLSSLQQTQGPVLTSDVSLHPTVNTAFVVTQANDTYPRLPYRSTPDALNDVFLLHLKFADTMSKLEKSVQIRDQLLQHDRTSSLSKSRTETQWIDETRQLDRRSRHGRRSNKSEASSDSSVVNKAKPSDESFSSSAYSDSSVDSTLRRDQTNRMGYPNFGVSRATTAETLAPSALGGDTSPSEEVTGRVSMAPASSMTQSPYALPENDQNRIAGHTPFDEQESEVHRTPTTESSATTPTTGSDQKSTSSLSKQVRFGDDAYSTPVLARKFNFDGPSISDDDYEEKDEEARSVLSFLGGSSVTSAELNDVSFLQTFERFRRELNASRFNSVTQSPLQLPLARKLFPEQNVSKVIETTNIAPRVRGGVPKNTVKFTGEADVCDNIPVSPALDGLSIEELQVLRRQLCLDIQAESAQLVLNLDRVHTVAVGSQNAEQTRNHLQAMRDELKAINDRLQSLA